MYKARDTANHGQMVALKKVRVPLTEEGVPMSTLREISLLKQMEKYEHPNIVRSVLHYSGRYRVLPSFFSSFHFRLSVDVASVSSSELVFTKLNMVFLHYSGRYRVLPSFTEFYRVFLALG